MTNFTCVVDGHWTPDPLRKGMCNVHYKRWWRTGSTKLTDRSPKPCTLTGCEEPSVARGWCRPHWRHWQYHGHPTVKRTRTPRARQPKPTCTREGCGEPQHAKGLCHRDYSRQWYYDNIERAKATQAAKRARNREQYRLNSKAWNLANPERAAASRRRWYAANRDYVLEYRRRYRHANRQAIRMLNAGRRARKRNAPGTFTAREWQALKATYRHRCAYCHRRRRLTIDHVVPLSRGGWHTASNIVPACQSCNSSKGDREAPTYQPLLV